MKRKFKKIEKQTNSTPNKSGSILDLVAQKTEDTSSIKGIVSGVITHFSDEMKVYVEFSENTAGEPVAAKSIIELSKLDINEEVILMFENEEAHKPVIMGKVKKSYQDLKVEIDGDVKKIKAKEELLLQCGDASILLRKDGKVVIKGVDIISRARKNNKIKGGSIRLN